MKKLFFILFLFSCSEIKAQNVRLFQYTSNASGTCQIWNLAQNINTGALFYCKSVPPSTTWTPIPVGMGAVNIGLAGLITNGISYADTTATLVSTAALSNGQLLIGNTGNPPSLNTLTAGTGIAIGNGAGTITISTSGIPSSSLSITTTTCTNQFISSLASNGIGTCTGGTPQFIRAGFGAAADGTALLNLNGTIIHGSTTGIGIGTTSQNAALHVYSTTAMASGVVAIIENQVVANSTRIDFLSNGTTYGIIGTAGTGAGQKINTGAATGDFAIRLANQSLSISNDSGTTRHLLLNPTGSFSLATTGPHAIGGTTTASDQFKIDGSFTGGTDTVGLSQRGTLTGIAGNAIYGHLIVTTLVEASSGTHGLIAGIHVNPTITNGAATTTDFAAINIPSITVGAGTTNATGLRIAGPTGATNIYALRITSGIAQFDGQVLAPGLTNANAQDYVCYNTTTKELEQNVTTCNLSTEAVKHDINLITSKDSLDIVKKMQPVSFILNIHPELGERIGFTAQRTEPIDKRLVTYFKDGSLRSVDYMGYTAILTGAIQEHDIEIQLLKNRIIELERKVN